MDAVVRATVEVVQGAPRGSLSITQSQRTHAETAIAATHELMRKEGRWEDMLAILDPRLRTMGYGRRFLASLPPAPVTYDLSAVGQFFK